jgi:hypothetical protein
MIVRIKTCEGIKTYVWLDEALVDLCDQLDLLLERVMVERMTEILLLLWREEKKFADMG